LSEEIVAETVVADPIAPEVLALTDKVKKSELKYGELYLCVSREDLLSSLKTLKESPDLQYTLFSECVAVDYSTWTHERDFDDRFEVIYNLVSIKLNRRIFIKTSVSDGASIPTAKHIFIGAEYPEKEIGDMYGIVFDGNELMPGSRFMLPDDWVGHPLRKEYPLGGDEVIFDKGYRGPAVENESSPHAGESFEGKTGSQDISGR
jgi:NADH-quinone oxidoreductase subunit C